MSTDQGISTKLGSFYQTLYNLNTDFVIRSVKIQVTVNMLGSAIAPVHDICLRFIFNFLAG